MELNMQENKFMLSLAMAGGVSAGSYIAGVCDFITEALDEWQLAKENDKSVPNHEVIIPALCGNSAGGICTGLWAAVLYNQGCRRENRDYYHEILYDVWVKETQLIGANSLCDTPQDSLESVFNSKLITDIINRYAAKIPQNPTRDLAYIAKKLHLFIMNSDVNGTQIPLDWSGDKWQISNFSDRFHFICENLGKGEISENQFLRHDAINEIIGNGQETQVFQTALQATCALPMVFPSVAYNRKNRDYSQQYIMPEAILYPKNTQFFAQTNLIDGGLFHNKPFDYAHFAIIADDKNQNPRTAQEANRAVLMINPLPSAPAQAIKIGEKLSMGIIGNLFAMLIDQQNAQYSDILLAMNHNIYSRFIIAPKPNFGHKIDENQLISGLFGGFAGFIKQQWRHHDFMLGRKHAQLALKNSLIIPKNAGNKIFNESYKNHHELSDYPIIPLYGTARDEVIVPKIEALSHEEWQEIQEAILTRLKKLWDFQTAKFNFWQRSCFFIGKPIIFMLVKKYILANLAKTMQLNEILKQNEANNSYGGDRVNR